MQNFNYKIVLFSRILYRSILKCKIKIDFKMGTEGALLLEGALVERLPPRRGGASEASTLIKVLPHTQSRM